MFVALLRWVQRLLTLLDFLKAWTFCFHVLFFCLCHDMDITAEWQCLHLEIFFYLHVLLDEYDWATGSTTISSRKKLGLGCKSSQTNTQQHFFPNTWHWRGLWLIQDQFWNHHDKPLPMAPLPTQNKHFLHIFGKQSRKRCGKFADEWLHQKQCQDTHLNRKENQNAMKKKKLKTLPTHFYHHCYGVAHPSISN